jgi:hypothetical protein
MRARLALRKEMCGLLHRVWQQRALCVQPDGATMAPWPSASTPSQMRWPTALKPPVSESESASGNEAYYDAEEPPAAETPPIDQGANRADGYHTPPSGRSPAPAPAKKTWQEDARWSVDEALAASESRLTAGSAHPARLTCVRPFVH